MPVELRAQRVGEVADGIDVAHLAVREQAGDQSPVRRARAWRTGHFPAQNNHPDLVLDRVGGQLQTAVFNEPVQAEPARRGVAHVLG